MMEALTILNTDSWLGAILPLMTRRDPLARQLADLDQQNIWLLPFAILDLFYFAIFEKTTDIEKKSWSAIVFLFVGGMVATAVCLEAIRPSAGIHSGLASAEVLAPRYLYRALRGKPIRRNFLASTATAQH